MKNLLIYSLYDKKYSDIGIEKTLNLIKENDINDNVGGIEINTSNLDNLKYCAEFCIKNDYKFKVHFPLKEMSEKEIKDYLDCVSKISDEIGYTVNVVIHSVSNFKDMNQKITKTKLYLEKILNYIEKFNLNVNISLENLNVKKGEKRINLKEIDTILKCFKKLNFTYDIGHDLYDNRNVSFLSSIQNEKLNNVHIHSVLNGEDHHVINESSIDIEQIKDSISYLKDINYSGDIVLEYSVSYLVGDTLEEKIKYYVQLFKLFKKILK